MILPTNSINIYKGLVQKLCLPKIALGQRRQFIFGINALAAQKFTSLNSNARTTELSRSAAESKMARMLKNIKLLDQLSKLYLKLSHVRRVDIVNVDHSEFSGLSVLMFATQTRRGRALPLYLETMPSLVQGHNKSSHKYYEAKNRYKDWKEQTGLDQFGYTIHCIGKLKSRLGYIPKLVFDRGFCNKRILKYLKQQHAVCYIRANSWVRVKSSAGVMKRLDEFSFGSHNVSYGCKLRLIVGDTNEDHPEPWYILTTDMSSALQQIIDIYYHRFEIEELFRDIKSILHTKNCKLKKHTSLAVLLWFVSLGILLLYMCYQQAKELSQKIVSHPKKRLSIYRQIYEEFTRSLRRQVTIPIDGCHG